MTNGYKNCGLDIECEMFASSSVSQLHGKFNDTKRYNNSITVGLYNIHRYIIIIAANLCV